MAKQRKDGLYLRGRIWWCRYYDGDTLIKKSLGTDDQQLAHTLFASLKRPHQSNVITVQRVMDLYHHERGQFIARKSYPYSRNKILKHLGHVVWSALQPPSPLIKNYKRDRLKEVQAGTLNIEIGMLSAAANVAIKAGWDIRNYWQREKVTVYSAEPLYLTKEQAEALLEAARFNHRKFAHHQKPTLYNWLCIALGTGMRMSEILGLRREDIDLVHDVIRLKTSKSQRPHVIPMSEGVRAACLRCLENPKGVNPNPKGVNPNPRDWLFPSPVTEGHIQTIYPQFRNACKRADITITDKSQGTQGLKVHSTRHSVASWLVQDGESLAQVADLLNHSSIKVTERYAHLSPEGRRKTVKKLPF